MKTKSRRLRSLQCVEHAMSGTPPSFFLNRHSLKVQETRVLIFFGFQTNGREKNGEKNLCLFLLPFCFSLPQTEFFLYHVPNKKSTPGLLFLHVAKSFVFLQEKKTLCVCADVCVSVFFFMRPTLFLALPELRIMLHPHRLIR